MTLRRLLADLRAEVARQRPVEGPGIAVEATADGCRLHVLERGAPGLAAGGGACLARITGGGPGTAYTGDLYGAGPGESPTATGVAIHLPELASTAQVPTNTWLLVVPIGGAYYAQVAVWR